MPASEIHWLFPDMPSALPSPPLLKQFPFLSWVTFIPCRWKRDNSFGQHPIWRSFYGLYLLLLAWDLGTKPDRNYYSTRGLLDSQQYYLILDLLASQLYLHVKGRLENILTGLLQSVCVVYTFIFKPVRLLRVFPRSETEVPVPITR